MFARIEIAVCIARKLNALRSYKGGGLALDDGNKNDELDAYASLEGLVSKHRDIAHIHIDGHFAELRQGSDYVLKPGQLIEAAVHSLDERGLMKANGRYS
ncbi:hypothetical protein [Paenibacillus glycinis]|uniref:S1 motif domain-containing protein n=1 Tax=Paenibacillus glycinis TaxID=2697035 RepID=A0ABW9XQN1_9BACL|nr:hypothetical protein [Paenibacillus glycinis]NBD24960.1 hypothetical protein [Paenibacillus glycinis]